MQSIVYVPHGCDAMASYQDIVSPGVADIVECVLRFYPKLWLLSNHQATHIRMANKHLVFLEETPNHDCDSRSQM